ncbi:MAG: type II toxin-antitoxin system HicB family antitoxin [Firmicutes bacterium]|nr:type II toxin-antitoxin system HicB family antitoxin [Bacillota bacterium]
MSNIYPAVFKKDESEFVVTFPDLPGCITSGECLEEAYTMASEVLALWLDLDHIEHNPPSKLQETITKYGKENIVMLVREYAGNTYAYSEYESAPDAPKLIDKHLKKSGLSKYRVAKLLDVSESYINYIFSGKRTPSPKVAQKLGALLGFDWRVFFPSTEKVKVVKKA